MKLLSSAGIQLLLLLHLFFDLSAKTDALENSQSPSIRCREPWMCVYPNGYNRKPKVWRKYAQHKWRMEIHSIMAFRNRRQENETIFGYMQTERENEGRSTSTVGPANIASTLSDVLVSKSIEHSAQSMICLQSAAKNGKEILNAFQSSWSLSLLSDENTNKPKRK